MSKTWKEYMAEQTAYASQFPQFIGNMADKPEGEKMIYQVEDTDTGFKLKVLSSGTGRLVREVEMDGSHNPLAEAYGILERVHPQTHHLAATE